MSLNFSLTKIKNWQTLCYKSDNAEDLTGTTQTIIFMALGIGVPDITVKTLDRFWHRTFILEHAFGAWRSTPEGVVYFTRDEIAQYTGLQTNASSMTDAEFMKKLGRMVERHN